MAKTHKLGFGSGVITDHEDGTASYRCPGCLSQAFRVRIADVTGFSVTRGTKALQRSLRILGNGTELATVDVNHGVPEKIENWFRSHPAFGTTSEATPQQAPRLIAEELTRLAQLRDSGVLTDEEFVAQKARLLG